MTLKEYRNGEWPRVPDDVTITNYSMHETVVCDDCKQEMARGYKCAHCGCEVCGKCVQEHGEFCAYI